MKKKAFSLMILSSLFILGCNNSKEIKYYDVNALEEYIEIEGEMIPKMDIYSGNVIDYVKTIRLIGKGENNEDQLNLSFSNFVSNQNEKIIEFCYHRYINNFEYITNCCYFFKEDNNIWSYEYSYYHSFIYDLTQTYEFNSNVNVLLRYYNWYNVNFNSKRKELENADFFRGLPEDITYFENDKIIFNDILISYFNATIEYFNNHNLDYSFINYR